ncbi:unnamed protein product [Chironomus riparius]|uniref:Uncharacterized protein n=1 Tax=Chironomus riparius TaxID=315576 RepID=A0A9N9WX13_9DIPT|nr:unnamed protein product [Chironomus riparius]
MSKKISDFLKVQPKSSETELSSPNVKNQIEAKLENSRDCRVVLHDLKKTPIFKDLKLFEGVLNKSEESTCQICGQKLSSKYSV